MTGAELWQQFQIISDFQYNDMFNDTTRANALMSKAYRDVIFMDLSRAGEAKDIDDRLAHLLNINATPSIISGNLINLDTINFEQIRNNGLVAQFGASQRYNLCTPIKFQANISLVEPSTNFPKYELRKGNGSTISQYIVIYPTDTVCTGVKLSYYESPQDIDTTSTDDLLWGSPDLEDRVVNKAMEIVSIPSRDELFRQLSITNEQINNP